MPKENKPLVVIDFADVVALNLYMSLSIAFLMDDSLIFLISLTDPSG